MLECDLLQTDTTGNIRIGNRIIRWGMAALESIDLRSVAHPDLEQLAIATGETAHLGVMESGRVAYLDRVDSPQSIRLASRLGASVPAHSTALGKCILAHLPGNVVREILREPLERRTPHTITNIAQLLLELDETRARGYAADCEENEPAVACLAAPIFDHTGTVVAAVSASGPAGRVQAHPEIAGLVQAVAARISEHLGDAQ